MLVVELRRCIQVVLNRIMNDYNVNHNATYFTLVPVLSYLLWVCFVIGPIDDVLINVDCSNRFDRNDLCAGDHFWRLVVRKIESNCTRVSKVNTTLHRSPILRDYPTD